MASWRDGNKKGGKPQNQPTARGRSAPTRESARTDWRSKKGGTSNRAIKSNKPWAEKQADATAGKRIAYRVKLVLAFVILAGLVGGFIYIMTDKPTTLNLIVVAPQNESNGTWYSTNPFSTEVSSSFDESKSLNENLRISIDDASTKRRNSTLANPKTNWDDFFKDKQIRPSGPNQDVVAFYFVAPAVVKPDRDGNPQPFILSTGNDPLTRVDWISVKEILEKIADWDKPNIKKLVLFDAQRVEPITSLGPMYDRFPSAVKNVFEEIGNENLFVIVSHDDGQRSWTAPELGGGTAFSYFARYGLLGGANIEENDTTKDRIISFAEYARFLETWVSEWAKRQRNSTQTPMVLFNIGGGNEENAKKSGRLAKADFDITYFEPSVMEDFEDSNKIDSGYISDVRTRGSTLDSLWVRYNSLDMQYRPGTAAHEKPLISARVAALLIRCEQLFTVPESDEFDNIVNQQLEPLLKKLEIQHPKQNIVSLADAVNQPASQLSNEKRQTELSLMFTNWYDLIRDIESTQDKSKNNEAYVDKKTALSNFESINKEGLIKYSRTELAWMMWNGFSNAPDREPTLNDLENAIRVLGTPGGLEFVEIHFLNLLKENVDWENEEKSGEIRRCVKLAIKVRDASEKLLFGCKPHVQYWIKTEFDSFEVLRRTYEDRLLAGQYEDLSSKMTELLAEYKKLAKEGESIDTAKQIHDRALHEIPYYAAWATREMIWNKTKSTSNKQQNENGKHDSSKDRFPTDDTIPTGKRNPTNENPIDIEDIAALFAKVNQLTGVLNKWNDMDNKWIGDDQDLTDSIKLGLDTFKGKINERSRELWKASKNADTMLGIERILMCPLIDPGERAELRNTYIENLITQFKSKKHEFKSEENEPSKIKLKFDDFEKWVNTLDESLQKVKRDDGGNDDFVFSMYGTDWLKLLNEEKLNAFKQWCNETPYRNDGQNKTERPKKEQRFIYGNLDVITRIAAPSLAERKAIIELGEITNIRTQIDLIDANFMSLWKAERALEDFWGDNQFVEAGEIPKVAAPYFAKLANQYDGGCTNINDEQEYLDYRDRYKRYGLAARSLRIRETGPSLDFDPKSKNVERKESEVNIKADSLPEGTLYLFASRTLDRADIVPVDFDSSQSSRREPIDSTRVASNGVDYSYGVSTRDLKNLGGQDSTVFQTVVAFRGHGAIAKITAAHKTVPIPLEDFTVTTYEKTDATPPIVKVTGQGTGTTDVLFILDASGSMGTEMNEMEEGPAVLRERLILARETLKKLLNGLKGSKELRIGLMAYGHRAKLQTDKGRAVIDQNTKKAKYEYNYRMQIIDRSKLYLNNDVELLHPLNPNASFTMEDEYEIIIDKFLEEDSPLRPMGLTPLYRAILEAAEHLDPSGGMAPVTIPKQIVLLTDGVNETWDYEDNEAIYGPNITVHFAKLLDENKLNQKLKNVTLHVVGFGMADLKERQRKLDEENKKNKTNKTLSPDDQKRLEKQKKLERLVKKLNGTTFYTNSASELRTHLEETVKLVKFSVVDDRDRDLVVQEEELLDLGSDWRPQQLPFEPGLRWVKVIGKTNTELPLFLYGGEVVTLNYSESGELKLSADNLNISQSEQIVMGDVGEQASYEVGRVWGLPHDFFHEFEFVVRTKNWTKEISRRPTALYLEVIPQNNSKAKSYYVQDYNYVKSRSFPVVRFGKVELEPDKYALRLFYVPFEKQLDLTQELKIEQGIKNPELGTARRVKVERIGQQVTVTISGGDPETLKKMWVHMDKARSSNRTFHVHKSEVEHQFELENIGENDPASLWIKEFDQVFGENDFVEFSFEKKGP